MEMQKMRARKASPAIEGDAIGMLSNPYTGKAGGYGMATYMERAVVASDMGSRLLSIDITPENVASIIGNGTVSARYWDGSEMHELALPSANVRVVYDYAGHGTSGSCDMDIHGQILEAFRRIGTKFVNDPVVREICDSKLLNHDVFIEAGVNTPATMVYSPDNAATLIAKTGFIFIKKVVGEGGMSQFTISKEGNRFLVKDSDDFWVRKSNENVRIPFGKLDDALEFIEGRMDGSEYLVQEGIKIAKIDGRSCSFRVLFQRNGSGNLDVPVIYAYVGAKGFEQSNVDVVAEDPAIVSPNFESIRGGLVESGVKVLKALERKAGSPSGEIGFDIVLGEDMVGRYLEINDKPGTGLTRELAVKYGGDLSHISESWSRQMEVILRNPIAYAQHLMRE
ncbi:MAG: hypothetical protein KGH72_00805 [Candidatus Micrarchaeota archaeon]|nr:hypothetical protein [Candidatus Micrarchaeota archaeon]